MFNLYHCFKSINNNKKNKKNNNNNNNQEINEYIILKSNFENNECVICLENMVINEQVEILECGHIYHYKCINDWIKKKGKINCPLCSN